MIRHEVAGTTYVEIETRGRRHPWYRVSLKPAEEKLMNANTEEELHRMELFSTDRNLLRKLKRIKNNIRVGAV